MKTPKMRTQKLARSCRLLPREPPATDGGSRRTCPADGGAAAGGGAAQNGRGLGPAPARMSLERGCWAQ